MSFKLKTVFLILSISLVPYIFVMVYLANTLKDEYHDNIYREMNTQLNLSVDKIDQSLETLQRNIVFLSQLDVMNDILSDDVDKRISGLLQLQKKEFSLYGDFHVVNIDGIIIASSDSKHINTKKQYDPFFSQKIYSSFDDSYIGILELEFSLQNIVKHFENTQNRQYYMIVDGSEILGEMQHFDENIQVGKPLRTKENIQIMIEQNQKNFLELLRQYEMMFFAVLTIGAIFIVLVSLYFINKLLKPVLELSKLAENVTNNQDYTYQSKVYANDEIGKLSTSFNRMVTGMHDALTKLKHEAQNREKLIEEKSKNDMLENLSKKLSRYLSPQVYQSIFSGEQDVTLTSQRKKLTVFFSDIVGFTDIADMMESEDLSELLNDYLNEMTLVALKYGATVDKYIGDSIMLFFGDPISKGVKEDAIACVSMALEMKEKMSLLYDKWKEKGFTNQLQVRIGINTGYCTVGNFGSQDRLEYTIIGSAVNVASRVESEAIPGEIFISQDTQNLVSDSFVCVKEKDVVLKGFKRPITLYSVQQYLKDVNEDVASNILELKRAIIALSDEEKRLLEKELQADLNIK